MSQKNPPIKILIVIVCLCVLGIIVSAKLLHIHIFTHTDPDFHSLCAVNEGINCETVALSPYSVFLNLPVCMWGIIGYTIMLGFSVWIFTQRKKPSVLFLGLFSFLTIVAIGVSAVLATISIFKIDSICLFCLSSYIINFLLFFLVIAARSRFGTSLFTTFKIDIQFLIRKPVAAIMLFVACVLPVGIVQMTTEPYWESVKWLNIQPMDSGIDENGFHWTGATSPTLTIVEFSDYQCPHCRLAHKKIRSLVNKYSSRVRLIHRQFPLDIACNSQLKREFHPFACKFAAAAECAGPEGKFWEMNDALYGGQEQNRPEDIDAEKIAVQLGLDRSKFVECMKNNLSLPKIKSDIKAAVQHRITGTPTFIVGEQKFVGGISEQKLLNLLGSQ